ncbi:MAG: hypothetical protein HQ517_11070, partial [SAR324 cluster bacterium]|nr:hypothetical protein [SAR324 cluster bacterium]
MSDVLRSRYADVHAEFIGQSEAVRQLKAMVERVAPTSTTVLITGET